MQNESRYLDLTALPGNRNYVDVWVSDISTGERKFKDTKWAIVRRTLAMSNSVLPFTPKLMPTMVYLLPCGGSTGRIIANQMVDASALKNIFWDLWSITFSPKLHR